MSHDTQTNTRLFTPWLVVPDSYAGPTMDDGRAEMQLTAADLDAYYAGGDNWTQVTDQVTSTQWLVRRADCGAGCRCAAEAKPVPEPGAGGKVVDAAMGSNKTQVNGVLPMHEFTVTIAGCSREEAEQVLTERLGHDEDYGFDYEIAGWR